MDCYNTSKFDGLNIYEKEYFTLYSKERDRKFPFVRYTGTNYEMLCSYIHAMSPKTQIWDEEKLRIGTLYTYSGRTSLFYSITEYNVRCIIASLPFLVEPNREIRSLALSDEDAFLYLREHKSHLVFPYKSILDTYQWKPEENILCCYSQTHPNGIQYKELPRGNEWYIGSFDQIHSMRQPLLPVYDQSHHNVRIDLQLNSLVEQVERLKYNINLIFSQKGKQVLFNPRWDDYKIRTIMATPCYNEYLLSNFIAATFSILFEETSNWNRLKTQRRNDFVYSIAGLHKHYANLNDASETTNINIIYAKYLEHEKGPLCADEYKMIQVGLLLDFVTFLEDIYLTHELVESYKAVIEIDSNGVIHCGDVMLPLSFSAFVGSVAVCVNIEQNRSWNFRKTYPRFCRYPSKVLVEHKGIIEIDDDKIVHCGKYRLPFSLAERNGEELAVSEVSPFPVILPSSKYVGQAIKYTFSKAVPTSILTKLGDLFRQLKTLNNTTPNPSSAKQTDWLQVKKFKMDTNYYYKSVQIGNKPDYDKVKKVFDVLVKYDLVEETDVNVLLLGVRITGRMLVDENDLEPIVWNGSKEELAYFINAITKDSKRYAKSQKFYCYTDGSLFRNAGAAKNAESTSVPDDLKKDLSAAIGDQ